MNEPIAEPTWRERIVARGVPGPERAESRSEQFLRAATDILVETGRTDFRVQELVERSRTSLRTFYQHFKSKDELLLALIENVMVISAREWRRETAELNGTDAMRIVLSRMYARSDSTRQLSLNRALSAYHAHLAETHPAEYARVLGPVRELVVDLLERGVASGEFRTDVSVDTLSILLTHTAMGAARLHAMGIELTGDILPSEALWQFCMGGLTTPQSR